MKKLLVICLTLLCIPAFAQKLDYSKLPTAVKNTFSTNFSGVTNVTWEKEHGNYEANFIEHGKKMSITFDEKGTMIEAETQIEVSQLPAAVTVYVEKNYSSQKIKGASIIKTAKGTHNYEAEISGKDLIFDANGKFIKESKD